MIEKTIELKKRYEAQIERLSVKIEVLDELLNELMPIEEAEVVSYEEAEQAEAFIGEETVENI